MLTKYTPEQVEAEASELGLKLTRAQLIDHLLDEMNKKDDEDTTSMSYLVNRQNAIDKLQAICPKRK